MTDELSITSVTASAPAAAPGAIGRHTDAATPTPVTETISSEPTPATAPERTRAQQEADFLDASFWDESASPTRYSFEKVPAGAQHSPEQELAMRSLFAAEQVPVGIGSHLSAMWNRSIANPPTPDANAAAAQRVVAELSRDPARGAETIRLAQAEVQAIAKRNPAVIDMLEQSGLGNDRWLIEHLANRARARTNRGK